MFYRLYTCKDTPVRSPPILSIIDFFGLNKTKTKMTRKQTKPRTPRTTPPKAKKSGARLCKAVNCDILCSYNLKDQKTPRFCKRHKTPDMDVLFETISQLKKSTSFICFMTRSKYLILYTGKELV
jgi:hypothetical protein